MVRRWELRPDGRLLVLYQDGVPTLRWTQDPVRLPNAEMALVPSENQHVLSFLYALALGRVTFSKSTIGYLGPREAPARLSREFYPSAATAEFMTGVPFRDQSPAYRSFILGAWRELERDNSLLRQEPHTLGAMAKEWNEKQGWKQGFQLPPEPTTTIEEEKLMPDPTHPNTFQLAYDTGMDAAQLALAGQLQRPVMAMVEKLSASAMPDAYKVLLSTPEGKAALGFLLSLMLVEMSQRARRAQEQRERGEPVDYHIPMPRPDVVEGAATLTARYNAYKGMFLVGDQVGDIVGQLMGDLTDLVQVAVALGLAPAEPVGVGRQVNQDVSVDLERERERDKTRSPRSA